MKTDAPMEPTDAEIEERLRADYDEPPADLNTSLAAFVLVENLPVVGEDRVARLEGVLTKVFAPCGPLGMFSPPCRSFPLRRWIGSVFCSIRIRFVFFFFLILETFRMENPFIYLFIIYLFIYSFIYLFILMDRFAYLFNFIIILR